MGVVQYEVLEFQQGEEVLRMQVGLVGRIKSLNGMRRIFINEGSLVMDVIVYVG